MRRLVLAALMAFVPAGVLAQTRVEDQAMTGLLRVCQDYSMGEVMETLVGRAQSAGFRRAPDLGGALGERLTWSEGEGARVAISLKRAEGARPKTCRIEVAHGRVNAVGLAKEVTDWALATQPAFKPADFPPDPVDTVFGPKAASRSVFVRAGERLIVERFDPPTDDFGSLLDNQAVIITLQRVF